MPGSGKEINNSSQKKLRISDAEFFLSKEMQRIFKSEKNFFRKWRFFSETFFEKCLLITDG